MYSGNKNCSHVLTQVQIEDAEELIVGTMGEENSLISRNDIGIEYEAIDCSNWDCQIEQH